ncbi:MAG: MDR family oxidoreductase [Klebsiella michiganensis]|nr:MDR family oxidoreductase [Klebsiella michiganensis]
MQALILEQQDGKTLSSVQTIDASQLPQGDVTVDIHWSSLNYKDALAITGKGKIIRNFPMIPGIDFAGFVHSSEDPRFHAGQQVLLTGWGVGENHWGGLAERARVKGDWLVAMPQGLDGRKAMVIGTAGFTAMLCVMALEDAGVSPEDGEVVVTGASGGVGSTAVALLHHLGYKVAAVSGRESQLWAGAVDTVGDKVLAKVLAQMNYGGCVAACGLAGGFALPTTVMPFILRNVRLQGVDSVMTPAARRAEAWQRLVRDLPESFYAQSATEISLAEAPEFADKIMTNKIQGRTLVKIA